MSEKIAKIVTVLFHPVLIPTLGLFIFFNSGFYFTLVSWEAKRYIILVVLFTTGVLPLLSVAIMALSPKFDLAMEKSHDRIIPLLSASVFYYLGYFLLNKLSAFPVFKLFLIASVLVIISMMVISFKWKISNHMAAIGGLTGALFALSFRSGMNPVWSIIVLIIVSGLVGTARLLLNKHKPGEVISGYALGFLILYFVIYFA